MGKNIEKNGLKRKSGSSFVKGALVLGVASLIVKLIGAGFKIPMTYLIDDDGMGLFNVAYQIYTFMFIVATAGFPAAISKMVAESLARDDERDAKRVFQTSFSLLVVIGLVGGVILFTFARQLANLVGMPDAELGIRAISPAVFFVSMASALRGYFQGRQNMYPTAFSEVIESTGKMAIGLLLASLFMGMAINPALDTIINFGARVMQSAHMQKVYASAGAIFGVTVGTFLSAGFLICVYLFFSFSARRYAAKAAPMTAAAQKLRPKKTILKELVAIAIPITIGASVSSLTTLIDMTTISRRLVVNPAVFDKYEFMFREGTEFAKKALEAGWSGVELNVQKATSLYGMYTGKALTMFNLPLTLIVALGTSIVPAISSAIARNNKLEAKSITESAIRIALLFGMPCAIGMSVLSSGVLNLLFSTDNAKTVLAILSIAIIPVAVVQVTNAILQSYGKMYYPVINMLIGGAAKVIFNFLAIPVLGIDGAPIGTFICYLIIAVINTVQIIRLADIKFSFMDIIIKPLIAAAVMGVCAYFLARALPASRIMTLFEIMVCAVIYGIMIFVVRAVKREDVLNLPKGEKIAGILERFKLIK